MPDVAVQDTIKCLFIVDPKLVEHSSGMYVGLQMSILLPRTVSLYSHQSSHAYSADATWYSSRWRTKPIGRKQ
jgi:hypothetical protein